MSNTIGDGMVSLALVGGIITYIYIKTKERQRKIEIIHEERMAAMEKGIPLPEFPFDVERQPNESAKLILPIMGIVLSSLALGTMIFLYLVTQPSKGFWMAPLPFAFLGGGLLAAHFMKLESRR